MRPPTVFANASATECAKLRGLLRGPWRSALRAVMVLLSLQGLPPTQIAALVECDPATVRRWIGRFNTHGIDGLHLGATRLPARITALLQRPGPWTVTRLHRYLGRPQISCRKLYRRVRQVAVWRRPKLIARGDPAHDAVVAAIVKRLRLLPAGAVVWVPTKPTCTCCPTSAPVGHCPAVGRTSPPRAGTGSSPCRARWKSPPAPAATSSAAGGPPTSSTCSSNWWRPPHRPGGRGDLRCQLLTTAAPWTSPWFPTSYRQKAA